MKNSRLIDATMALAICGLAAAVWAGSDPVPTEPDRLDASARPQSQTQEPVDRPTTVNKASGLLGMTVRDPDKGKLGKIEDIVFDNKSGRVAYAVLGSGGILGISEKKTAVPLSAFTPNPETATLVLNTTKERLEMAQGLKKDQWPSVRQSSWGAEPFWGAPASSGTTPRSPEQPNTGAEAPPASQSPNTKASVQPANINRASYVFGMAVMDPHGERLGTISDIVFDLQADKVAYTVLSTETTGVAFSRKMIAVPLTAYVAIPHRDSLVLNTTKAEVDAAQGFSQDAWPSVSHPDFGQNPIWARGEKPSAEHNANANRENAERQPANPPQK